MNSVAKFKEWVNENVPAAAVIYENKYVGMVYDRFASLPPKQQKQVILGIFASLVAVVFLFLLSAYVTLWSYSSRTSKYNSMVSLLLQYQKTRRAKSGQISNLGRNDQLSPPGAFKQALSDMGRSASISPRMIQVDEKEDGGEGSDDPKASHDVKLKTAQVRLQRVNLEQLKNYVQSIEFGGYNLSVSSLKITNDDKIRGYMNVEIGVVAYLFASDEGS